MRCIAHRGFAEPNPENTVPAVNAAVASGADSVEIDVRRCGSGELVVIHDETVDRVTDGSGRVSSLSLDALSSLDVLGTGRGVPTLGDVLDTVAGDVSVNVELKETGIAGDALALFDRSEADVLVSSFESDVLRTVAERGDTPCALLFALDPTDNLGLAKEIGCRAIHPHWRCCDDSLVRRAHSSGLRVNAWTIQSSKTASTLATAGVDGLISDAPEYCR